MAACLRPPTIIIDSGTGYLKAGLSGPHKFPNVMQRTFDNFLVPTSSKTGKENVQVMAAIPVDTARGYVVQPELCKQMWGEAFQILNVDPTEHPVLLTESAMGTLQDRQRTAEIMFEEFNTPGLYIGKEAALSLRWYDLSTGVVVDCGDRISSIVLFENGRRIADPIILDYGGLDVTALLASCLVQLGYRRFASPTSEVMEAVRKIKEEYGYVSLHYYDEAEKIVKREPRQIPCEAFPQETIYVYHELFSCAEGLFEPSLFRNGRDGLVHATVNAIGLQSPWRQSQLLKSIVLCGGSTIFPSFLHRFWRESLTLIKYDVDVSVNAKDHREYSAWLGGNELACTDTFHNKLLVSKSSYKEEGSFVFEKKQTFTSFFDFSAGAR